MKKEESVIILNDKVIGTELEIKLHEMMYQASKDGILESREFEKWCSNNYSKILKWFDNIIDYQTDLLVSSNLATPIETTNLKVFKNTKYVIDSKMMDEAIQMKGLKLFLEEFSMINEKETIEVNLLEYYLIYAQIFGIADKVAKQFKKLYSELIENYNFDDVIFLNAISYREISSATTSQVRANSYSSGGGGGSFGGGGELVPVKKRLIEIQ